MKVSKDKIQQLFNHKVGRAVDIIFAQNKLDEVHDLYGSLLQYKKNNTSALKQALQNNYEKMLYCSELLNQTKKYAQAVGEVAHRIQNQINQINGKSYKKQSIQQNQIKAIQQLIRNQRFYEAIAKCNNNQNKLSISDNYYLLYIKIELLNKLQRHMRVHLLNQHIMNVYIKCLHEMLFENKPNGHAGIRNKLQWMKDFKQKSLISIIYSKMQILGTISSQKQIKHALCEIIFQFKLLLLKSKFKNKYNSQSFQQYFAELSTILRISKSISHQKQVANLTKIWDRRAPHIKQQLASIFIQNKKSGEILFKCDLYDDLLKNDSFKTMAEKFHKQLSQNGREVDHPLKFVRQLWHDYFVNLIDYSVVEINPLARVSTLKQNSLNIQKIPAQLAIYLHDYSIEQSLNIINEYEGKIKMFQTNIIPIITRCNQQQIQIFKQKIKAKIQQLEHACLQFIRSFLFNDYNSLSFRKYILLRIICAILHQQLISISNNYNLQLNQNSIVKIFEQLEVYKYWNHFINKLQPYSPINQALINLDSFFIGYIQGVSHKQKNIVADVIKQITMKILVNISQHLKDGREKECVQHTIESLKLKKEKVTIFQTIVVPYLAHQIYQCEMKSVAIDKQFYDENFVSKQVKKPIKVQQIQEIDGFQIGQKQEKEDLVKVRIGKTIMNLGNNLISGLMTKKK